CWFVKTSSNRLTKEKNLPANWQVSEQIVQPDLDRARKICSNKFRFLSAKNHHFELVIEG
ncbi:hypothetical protein OFD51_30860, partial [Escherichia coli]|nr:hypothetical protein [Escherichia coli]